MKVQYLVAEIGSTTTLVTALNFKERKTEMFQGKSYTTVLEGDVNLGLKKAISDIEEQIGEKLYWDKMIATSSAAGGLKITVHGLVEDMTVKAAREAALGAGGIIKFVTAGKMRERDLERIRKINPNLIMIAGGTDYGERETAIYNAEAIAKENFNIPIVYCGNIANREEIRDIFEEKELYIIDNVYPRIDELKVEPARKIIQEAFEKNIIKAPGMHKIKDMVNGAIMPTPGAVMECSKLLYDLIGDLVVFDVGGATTDVHSITEGSIEILDILVCPEPKAKRTVEGDLGVYVNSENIIDILDIRDISLLPEEKRQDYKAYIKENIVAIPEKSEQRFCSTLLTKKAVEVALSRHVGYVKRRFDGSKNLIAYGKDLSMVKYIIGTGGALTKLNSGRDILSSIRCNNEDVSMNPKKNAEILIDDMYIMACAGVLSRENKEHAIRLIKESLKL